MRKIFRLLNWIALCRTHAETFNFTFGVLVGVLLTSVAVVFYLRFTLG